MYNAAEIAYLGARSDLAAEIADLQRWAEGQPAAGLESVDWAAVGSMQALAATLHDLTDRVHARGEYARVALS